MAFPDPTAYYYLRNSHTHQYLISPAANKLSTGAKAEDDRHWWKFIPHPTSTNYYLQNVGTKQFLGTSSYSTNNGGYCSIDANQSQSHAWQVLGTESPVTIAYSGYYLHDEGSLWAVTSSYVQSSYDQWTRNQWCLDPTRPTPPPTMTISMEITSKNLLPEGIYRIRTFNGEYLLTMPSNAQGEDKFPFVSKQVPNNAAQRWLVTPVPNSTNLYTISNLKNGLYLAGSASNLTEGSSLVGQSCASSGLAFHWSIQTFGPGVMFFIGLKDSPLSIGFVNYEAANNKAVTLVPSDNIPSQIWFFETFRPLAPAIFHGKRHLNAGRYKIEMCHDNSYLNISATTDDLTTVPTRPQGTEFDVTYADDHTPNFTLSYTDSEGMQYIYSDGDRIATSESRRTEWVLLAEKHDDATVNHIVEAGPTDSYCSAFSARKIKDRKKSHFAIEPLAEREVMQMWRFHEATRNIQPSDSISKFTF